MVVRNKKIPFFLNVTKVPNPHGKKFLPFLLSFKESLGKGDL